MAPLPFGSYGFSEPPAFEWARSIVVQADLVEPILTFHNAGVRQGRDTATAGATSGATSQKNRR
jgi:hypothetical protein